MRFVVVVLLLNVFACVAADEVFVSGQHCEMPEAFNRSVVTVDGDGHFVHEGETFIPQGVGSYPLLEHAGNDRMDHVRDIFRQARELGRPLVRTNAFFDGGQSPARLRNDDGTLNEDGLVGLDRLLAAAEEEDVSLILALTNNWTDYGGAEAVLRAIAPTESLPKDAFWTDARAIEAQRNYVDAIISRTNTVNGRAYAEDPTVFAWELANEARCEECASSTLTTWARTMALQVRSSGATQLVAWGGIGYRDDHGENFEEIARDGAVDILTIHMYPLNSAAPDGYNARVLRYIAGAAMGAARVQEAARIARSYGAALIIEEFGWRPATDDRDEERALVMREWVRAAQEEGVGTLPWMIAEAGRPDYDGFLIQPDTDTKTAAVLRCL